MGHSSDPDEPWERVSGQFTTTHWSLVLTAGHRELPQAADALEELCHAYWYPLYGFVQRRGYRPEDSQHLTQAFFANLLRKDFLSEVGPEKGRYREVLREQIAHTVTHPEEIEEEMRYLFEVVSR